MTRNNLEKRISLLTSELAEVGTLVEKQIYDSIIALKSNELELANEIIKNDDKVDLINRRVEEKCLKLMATESPLATDLRKIFATSKIVTDLERMADYAVDICKITKRVSNLNIDLDREYEAIKNMFEVLKVMIKKSIDAFINGDAEEALEICKLDDEVDNIYRSLFTEVLKDMAKDEDMINKGTQILFVSKYLERVGDHVTNICEWIIFSTKGDYVDLNE